jgi:tRNA(Arg) A34 adenosine deaminase TadA
MQRKHLLEAIHLAQQSVEMHNGGPFGAVVAKEGLIVGRGFNRVTASLDPTAHAEIVAIRDACARLQTFSLAGCELYASCEPCPMCLAAIYWARLERVHYAATRVDAAGAGFDDATLHADFELPHDQRHIQLVPFAELRPEALIAFEAWQRKEDRVQY